MTKYGKVGNDYQTDRSNKNKDIEAKKSFTVEKIKT